MDWQQASCTHRRAWDLPSRPGNGATIWPDQSNLRVWPTVRGSSKGHPAITAGCP